jgi:uncharacterized Zn-finger protein
LAALPELIFMADRTVPHFHNDAGVNAISIGAHEFMCIGALPPFDHPHIFIDMGDAEETICSYCSTVFRFDADLKPTETRPPGCLYQPATA